MSTRSKVDQEFVEGFDHMPLINLIAPQLNCKALDAMVAMLWAQGAIGTAQIWAARHADVENWDGRHHAKRLHVGEHGEMVWLFTPPAQVAAVCDTTCSTCGEPTPHRNGSMVWMHLDQV